MNKFVTLQVAKSMLKVSENTLMLWAQSGLVTSKVSSNGQSLYDISECTRLFYGSKSNKSNTTPTCQLERFRNKK